MKTELIETKADKKKYKRASKTEQFKKVLIESRLAEDKKPIYTNEEDIHFLKRNILF